MTSLDRNTPSCHKVSVHMIFTADLDNLMTDSEAEMFLRHMITVPDEVLSRRDSWRLDLISYQLLERWIPGGERVRVERE